MNAATKNEIVEVEQANIATLPPAARAAVVLRSEQTRKDLATLAAQSAGIVAVLNADGREQAHRIGMTLKNARVTIEKTGKAAREDATAFSKAVIAEEKALIALVGPEESRILALRDEWDSKIEAEKQAKIAAERARVDAIRADIDGIYQIAFGLDGAKSTVIKGAIDMLEEIEATEARFAEFKDDAAKVISTTMERLVALHMGAEVTEAAALAAEEARKAEAARIEAERAELARLREEQAERERLAKIESDRIAAEQAAEGKRIADRMAAEQAALQAERDRIAAEQARAAAELKAAQERLEADRAAHEAKLRLESDHAEALELNAHFDLAREAERTRLQALADQAAADARERAEDERKAGLPAGALRAPEVIEGPSDQEIIELVAVTFDMTVAQAVERLAEIDFAMARAEVA